MIYHVNKVSWNMTYFEVCVVLGRVLEYRSKSYQGENFTRCDVES